MFSFQYSKEHIGIMQRGDFTAYQGTLRSLGGSASTGMRNQAITPRVGSSPAQAVDLNSDDDGDGTGSEISLVQETVVADTNVMRRESSDMLLPGSRNSSEVIGSQRSGQVFLRPSNPSAAWAVGLLPSHNVVTAPPLPPLPPKKRPVPHVLVVGNPQSGKSTFINNYRSCVCLGTHWPSAPTGMCGLQGTTRVDGYPNNIERPQWILVDTPGRVYDTSKSSTGDEDLLDALIRGVPWKSTVNNTTQLDTIPSAPQHKCHHCIIIVNALDYVVDRGQWAVLRLQSRYACGGNAGMAFFQLQHLVASIRTLLNDTPPYVVVTHMDQVGGVDCAASKAILLQTLSRCISPLRTYFIGQSEVLPTTHHAEQRTSHHNEGVKELRKMHQDLLKSLHWLAEQSDEETI
ncbi:50S ribosome-binding GTPase, putative [Bodo saltans]|uniref:50S ribosome-binding GTPase, putative n=1 Tax=Bodo saltans TaxID=75058 RepID=A0A0S4JLN7_BODSA|nr:50S ribosome-binding GTPase, putative [Bodo saltans]|eukprot:CUG92436.1 50S ribosome-binding GTPase, putative [Bodo saltans]